MVRNKIYLITIKVNVFITHTHTHTHTHTYTHIYMIYGTDTDFSIVITWYSLHLIIFPILIMQEPSFDICGWLNVFVWVLWHLLAFWHLWLTCFYLFANFDNCGWRVLTFVIDVLWYLWVLWHMWKILTYVALQGVYEWMPKKTYLKEVE